MRTYVRYIKGEVRGEERKRNTGENKSSQREDFRTGGENRESGDTYEDLHSRQNTL